MEEAKSMTKKTACEIIRALDLMRTLEYAHRPITDFDAKRLSELYAASFVEDALLGEYHEESNQKVG
jgi:hypothetical protein